MTGFRPNIFSEEREKLSGIRFALSCFLTSCQKVLVIQQDQKRWSRFSGSVLQKVQRSSSLRPILFRKSFVDSLLCGSLN